MINLGGVLGKLTSSVKRALCIVNDYVEIIIIAVLFAENGSPTHPPTVVSQPAVATTSNMMVGLGTVLISLV